jgi:hypothetical protein
MIVASCRAAVVFFVEIHETCLLDNNESFSGENPTTVSGSIHESPAVIHKHL